MSSGGCGRASPSDRPRPSSMESRGRSRSSIRAVGDRREVAVRMVLGASRRQIAAELLTRGLVLGLLSGAAGLLCGLWTRDLLVGLAPATIPRLQHVELNTAVLTATGAVSIL